MRKLTRVSRLAGACALTLGAASSAVAQDLELVQAGVGPQKSGSATANYIVRLREAPVVAYDGGIPGLRATKPGKGRKIDQESKEVVDYVGYLNGRHNGVLNGNGGGAKLHGYYYTFNGFAARLTESQALRLQASPDVVAVWKDEELKLDTNQTPAFLGLTASGGLWSQLGGIGRAGEDVIIGIVDSGFWPESRSFSDRDNGGKLVYKNIPHWKGKCRPAEAFNASHCNQKVIGARHYNTGFGGDAAVKARYPNDFNSPRDGSSHGSHTASTAGGNSGVQASAAGVNLGEISGMAPRARLSIYKSCYGDGATSACFTSDSVAAIDQAVADGVDVINYSISGSTTSNVNAVEVAFLFAADAGVFVATSAGNSGPTVSTVAHNAPWTMTVAAGTHDRNYVSSVTLGDGVTYEGASTGGGLASTASVLASNSGLPVPSGVDPALWASQVSLCFSSNDGGGLVDPALSPPGPRLDPAKIAGKIVVCDRGTSARVDKSLAVKNGGGSGMILTNVVAGTVDPDLHFVPSVHLADTDRAAINTYVGGGGTPTAALAPGVLVGGVLAPDVAAFSSRGPALASGGDILKPDIMAPGVAVLAATSPATPGSGNSFDFFQGTSMSSPHIAGIAALFKQRRPSWSPSMIKSALMTTAAQVRNHGSAIAGGPFAIGSGHVDPNRAVDPGLVYDAGFNDWLGFLCGTGEATGAVCSTVGIDPSNLNYPSIAIGALLGNQTVTRKVTNVGSSSSTYTATVVSPPGITTVVTPASFTIAPGETRPYEVQFTRTTATAGAFALGSLTWNDGTHSVRSPIAIRPQTLVAPAQVNADGSPTSYNVTFGYDGNFNVVTRGIAAALVSNGTVADDPTDSFVRGGPGTMEFPFVIAPNSSFARVALFDDAVDGAHDFDLYVYNGATLIASTGGATSNEVVTFSVTPGLNPIALTVVVHAYQTAGPSGSFSLFRWSVPNANSGNLTVSAPAAAVANTTAPINLTFSGLAAGTRYLGHLQHRNGTAPLPSTFVYVKTP